MIKNKIILIFIFTIILTNLVFSTPTVEVEYSSGDSVEFLNDIDLRLTVIVSNIVCESPIDVSISSIADNVGFDFPVNCSTGNKAAGYFYLDSSSSDPSGPEIKVNEIDKVTLSYSDSDYDFIVDLKKPTVGTFSLNGENEGDYFKENVSIVDVSNYTDGSGEDTGSGIKHYIAYVILTSQIDNYKSMSVNTSTFRRIGNITNISDPINLDLEATPKIDDGNYYVLLDVEDNAGNFISETNVKNSKKLLIVDNTPPVVTDFSLGDLEDGGKYYISSSNFVFSAKIEDSGVGIDSDNTKLREGLVELIKYDSEYGGISFDFNSHSYENNSTYNLDLHDLLGNNETYSFTISVDTTPPPAPSSVTVSRAINNDMTITWTWAKGDYEGSDIKEYKIYRHDSNFSDVTSKTLICTVSAESINTCSDTSSKSNNKTYYYGVVAIDMVGNVSDVLTESAKTGPSISVDMDFDYSTYVKSTTPKIELSFSSNVSDVRFSCNGTSFSAWQEVSGTSQNITNFNVTSGNGCTTEQGSRTLYVEARDEDDNTLITRASFDFRLDTQAPTVPVPNAVQQTDGGIKVSWNASTDSGSGVLEYFVYYSETSSVSESSQSHKTSSTQFIYKPNIDQKFYFRVLAVDRVGNRSALSTTVSADSKRYGPSYVFDVVPKNIVDDVIYLKRGVSNFTITSDENLKETPVIRMKRDSQSFQTLANINYNNKITTFTYDFETSGEYIIEITGANNNNQSTTETFEFTVDAQVPSFDVNFSFDENTKKYTFSLDDGFSEDIFRVEYLLNNTETICFLVDSDNNYECVLDTIDYEDGEYKVHVYGYDIALNYFSKIIDIEIDNIDQNLIERENLIKEVNKNKQTIETRINFLEIINKNVSEDILNDFDLAKDKILQANDLFNEDNISQSNDLYNLANNLLLEIISKIPKETEVKSKTFVIDLDNVNYDLNTYILDANIIQDTLSFYQEGVLEVSREFKVFEISGENYYSSTLFFENKSDEDIVISFIEFIPTDFAKRAGEVYFDRDVVILRENPVILYNLTIPKNSNISTKYIRIIPISNLDILANFDRVVYKDPILISGSISSEDIDIKPSLVDTRTILFASIALLIFIVIILVVSLIFSANKNKNKAVSNLGSKDEINKYLGSSNIDYKKENITLKEALYDEKKSDIEEKNKHDSNYDFILNAVKNKKN